MVGNSYFHEGHHILHTTNTECDESNDMIKTNILVGTVGLFALFQCLIARI